MRLLFCSEQYPPYKGGMSEVVWQLTQHLRRLGHSVTVVTKSACRNSNDENGYGVVEFDIAGNLVLGIGGECEKFRSYLKDGEFDIVCFFAAQQWSTDLALEILAEVRGKKVFIPTGFSGLYTPAYAEYYSRMKLWIKNFDRVVLLSSSYRDAEFLRANNFDRTVVIPNGASIKEFGLSDEERLACRKEFRARLGIPEHELLMLHVGSFTGLKGQDDAIRIFRKSELQDVNLLLIGNVTNKKAYFRTLVQTYRLKFRRSWRKRVIIRTDVDRDFTIKAYMAADLFFFPSRVECSPIVLFEACAAAVPFLSTDVGNSEEIAKWLDCGFIMSTEKNSFGYSRAVVRNAAKELTGLLSDRARLIEAGVSGRRNWLAEFTWEKIALKYEAEFKMLLSNS